MASQSIGETVLGTDSNLAGYWKFDGNSNDSGTNAYNLTLFNSPTYSAGQFGSALACDSSGSQYAKVITCPNLSITGPQTWYMWFKATTHAMNFRLLYKNGGGPDGVYNTFDGTAYRLYGYLAGWTTNEFIPSMHEVTNGAWEQLVLTADGTNLNFYFNGTRTNQLAATGSCAANTNPFLVASLDETQQFANGVFDDVAIFSRALGSSEINALWMGTMTVPGTPTPFMGYRSLLGVGI